MKFPGNPVNNVDKPNNIKVSTPKLNRKLIPPAVPQIEQIIAPIIQQARDLQRRYPRLAEVSVSSAQQYAKVVAMLEKKTAKLRGVDEVDHLDVMDALRAYRAVYEQVRERLDRDGPDLTPEQRDALRKEVKAKRQTYYKYQAAVVYIAQQTMEDALELAGNSKLEPDTRRSALRDLRTAINRLEEIQPDPEGTAGLNKGQWTSDRRFEVICDERDLDAAQELGLTSIERKSHALKHDVEKLERAMPLAQFEDRLLRRMEEQYPHLADLVAISMATGARTDELCNGIVVRRKRKPGIDMLQFFVQGSKVKTSDLARHSAGQERRMIPVDLNAFGPDQNGWPRYVLRLVEQIESNKGKPIVPMLEAGPQGGKPEDHLRAAMKSAAHAEFPEIEKVLSKITVSPYLWRHIRGEDAWLQFRTEAAMSMPRPERHMSQIETIEHLRIYEDKQALWVPKLMKFFGHCGDRMWHNYGAKTQRDRRRPAFGNPRVSSPTKMRVRSLGRGGMSMGMRR